MTQSATWAEFAAQAPELARFGQARLESTASYLGTVRSDLSPRVHPVTAIVDPSVGLFVFMEPDSPKGRDLRARPGFALHNGVPDNEGSGGEFWVRGHALFTDDPADRDIAAGAAGYEPADRYILFHLTVSEARAISYGDISAPTPSRWRCTDR